MVITGAPNLSNEAGVREGVKSVSERERNVRGMRIRRETRLMCERRTKSWSCREKTEDGGGVHVSPLVWVPTHTRPKRDTLRRALLHHFSILICYKPCGMGFSFLLLFVGGIYLNPCERSDVYLLILLPF